MDREKAIKYMHDLLRALVDRDGSDLFITVGMPPAAKIDGRVVPMTEQRLTASHTQALVRSLMNDKQSAEFERHQECNFAIGLSGVSRFRVNVFTQRGSPGMVLRTINSVIPKFEDIQMPSQLEKITQERRGLVIFVGGTGSGKSTSLAAMIDFINKNCAHHIITIEDPVEFVHDHHKSIVNQRELHSDVPSFSEGLRRALREDPDVILVGEMRDLETISAAISAAETGHLVFGTLHTTGAARTVDRIIDAFPTNQQEMVRTQLAGNLVAVISQALLPKKGGKGRIAAFEIMIMTPAISNLIREGKTFRIDSAIQTSANRGMILLDDWLFKLYQQGAINFADMMGKAKDPSFLQRKVQESGEGAE